METITCPYCDARGFTSSPETMTRCSSCGHRFAVSWSEGQPLVILDSADPESGSLAARLNTEWQSAGRPVRAIVDRRRKVVGYAGAERRHFPASVA